MNEEIEISITSIFSFILFEDFNGNVQKLC
jgi:hypothetical protein